VMAMKYRRGSMG